jgi:small-conductance mechanosensitive channel
MGSFIPTMIAGNVMYKLKLTNHYEAKSYTLPYKVKKDLTLNYILLGVLFLGLVPGLFGPLTQDTVILFLIILVSISLLVTLMRWNGVILYVDHLCHYELWSKHNISYKDIINANVELFYGNSRHYQLTIQSRNRAKSLIKIHFYLISKSDRIIILSVIHQFAPQATMNELAEQMRNGDFPVT